MDGTVKTITSNAMAPTTPQIVPISWGVARDPREGVAGVVSAADGEGDEGDGDNDGNTRGVGRHDTSVPLLTKNCGDRDI